MKNCIILYAAFLSLLASCRSSFVFNDRINSTNSNGLKEGLWLTKNDTFKIYVIHKYKKSIPCGKYRSYHENGQVAAKGKFRHGRKFGKWLTYDKQGGISKIKTYNRKGEVIYFKKGNPDW